MLKQKLHGRLSLLAFALAATASCSAQGWKTPTPDELHMTAIPEVPGAEAVVLNREETDDDDNHMRQFYYRVKILSEGGIRLSDVELQYDRRSDQLGTAISDISGRTIQPDGTVVPLTAKPHDKLLFKDKENAFTARVFSMPAVQVGSILEYRYSVRWGDYSFSSPQWIIQTDLYLRDGHFHWKPTNKELVNRRRDGRESFSSRIVWAESLPKGVDVKSTRLANDRLDLDLRVSNIPPFGNEEYMPPIRSSQYHVFFYYTPYTSGQDFWSTEIKNWSTDTNKFARVTGVVSQQAQAAIASATTDEDRARRLYAYVMTFENTDFTRTRTTQEEKAEIKSAEDVLKRKRGSGDQIAMTYIALARAAGLQASAMEVSDRNNLILDGKWMDFNAQLTDTIAVVKYSGSEHYLDPGSRYTPFGHLLWSHTIAGGVRQDNPDPAKSFIVTPGDAYKYSHTSRVADLKLQSDGHMAGTVTVTYEGSPALRWRHVALREDERELREKLKKELEGLLPGGTEVEVVNVVGATDGEAPLKIMARVNGTIGNAVGTRVMLPACLFEANSAPTFPHATRRLGVYFPYNEYRQDAVRYTLPAGFTVEALPETKLSAQYRNQAIYAQTAAQTGNSVTVRRDLIVGDIYFPPEEYASLRTFYNDFEGKDHGSIVLKRAAESAAVQLPAATQ